MQGTLMYDIEVTVENEVQLKDLKQRIESAVKAFPEVTGKVEYVDSSGFSEIE